MTVAVSAGASSDTRSQSSLPIKTVAGYAAPNFALAIMHMPVAYIIPALYAKHTTVSLAMIGTILLFGRIFDAVTDPFIGYISDKTRSRFGRRKPFMVIGTPFAMIAMIFLFAPSPNVGPFYFLFWSVFLFASWTLIDIPYVAWGAELSRNYNERSRILTWRYIAGYAGSVAFMMAPVILQPWTGTTEINLLAMTIMAYFTAAALPLLLSVSLLSVPSGTTSSSKALQWSDFIKSFRSNTPLRYWFSAVVIRGIGLGSWVAVAFIYVDTQLGIADKFVFLLMAAWLTRILFAPVWLKLLYRFGKHRVWSVGQIAATLVLPTVLFIPSDENAFVYMLAYSIVLGFFETAEVVSPQAILGDIVDYDSLKTGSDKTSTFFALNGVAQKTVVGVGGGLAFYCLSLFQFDVSGSTEQSSNLGLLIAFIAIPMAMYAISAAIIHFFPLDARSQEIVSKALLRRQNRASIHERQITSQEVTTT